MSEQDRTQHYDRALQRFMGVLGDASGTSPAAIKESVKVVEAWREARYDRSKAPSEVASRLDRPDRDVLVDRLRRLEADDGAFRTYEALIGIMGEAERDPDLRRDVAVYTEGLLARK